MACKGGMSPKPQTTILSHCKAAVLSKFLLWRRVLILSSMARGWLVSGGGSRGCRIVRGRGLSRGSWTTSLLLCDLALCGIHRHLPDSEGPGGIVEQGQNGVECSHSILKENCAEETLVSPVSPGPAGTLPSRGKGPPSVQLLHTPAPPPLLQLSWLHQSQPRLGEG